MDRPKTVWVYNDEVDDPLVEAVELQLLPDMLSVDAIVEEDLLPEETLADFLRDILPGTDREIEWVPLPEAIVGSDRRALIDRQYTAWVFAA